MLLSSSNIYFLSQFNVIHLFSHMLGPHHGTLRAPGCATSRCEGCVRTEWLLWDRESGAGRAGRGSRDIFMGTRELSHSQYLIFVRTRGC